MRAAQRHPRRAGVREFLALGLPLPPVTVVDGVPVQGYQPVPMWSSLAHHQAVFGRAPTLATDDRGMQSLDKERVARRVRGIWSSRGLAP